MGIESLNDAFDGSSKAIAQTIASDNHRVENESAIVVPVSSLIFKIIGIDLLPVVANISNRNSIMNNYRVLPFGPVDQTISEMQMAIKRGTRLWRTWLTRFVRTRPVAIRWFYAGLMLGFALCFAAINTPAQNSQVTVIPSRGVPGTKYDLTLAGKPTAVGGNCTTPSLSSASTSLKVPLGSGLTLVGNPTSTADGCTLAATVSIDPDAPVGTVNLQLMSTGASPTLIELVPFQIVASIPGPIPPGLVPQVDVQWHVVDPNVTEDNFGHRIRKLFYCVQVTIGNNSGYDLQLSTIGFTANQETNPAFANTDYALVRGSLDWGQKTNWWSLVTLGLEAAGPVLSATLPLVANAAKRGERAQLIGLLTPFATAMAFIYPYQNSFSAQSKLLDDTSLRAGYVIHNNQQAVPVYVFVAKTNVPGYNSSTQCSATVTSGCKCGNSDLNCIKANLGKLVIIGESILYLNRISVVSASSSNLAPLVSLSPNTLNFGDVSHSSATGSELTLTITNSGDGPLTITEISESNPSLFSHSGTTGTCKSLPATLPPGGSCTISEVFKPTAIGNANALLSIKDNALGSPQTVILTGAGN